MTQQGDQPGSQQSGCGGCVIAIVLTFIGIALLGVVFQEQHVDFYHMISPGVGFVGNICGFLAVVGIGLGIVISFIGGIFGAPVSDIFIVIFRRLK